jgi:hypothetical protein
MNKYVQKGKCMNDLESYLLPLEADSRQINLLPFRIPILINVHGEC